VRNGWTGGQYSLFRAALAAYLFVHFAMLLPWSTELFSGAGALTPASASPLAHLFPNVVAFVDDPSFVRGFLLVGILATVPLGLGRFDRSAAVFLWYLGACLYGRNPLIANPSLPFVGWMLLAHAVLPRAPYGSWAARGRADPRGDWAMPEAIFLAAWTVLAVGYSYSGVTKLVSPSWTDGSALSAVLSNPLARPGPIRTWLLSWPPVILRVATWSALGLELLFAPLALFRRIRPWIWLAMIGLHLGLLVMVDFADLTLGMLLIHFLTFDPAWIPRRAARGEEVLFYDGHCGLCHGIVRFVLAERGERPPFVFAPLQGSVFVTRVPESRRAGLPDSVVVLTATGEILCRSAAVLHILESLGGLWRLAALLARPVPERWRDVVYDGVARARHRLFGRRVELCPIVPEALRASFLSD
jgi:predicted DCC family thiol-disulfide oxidoreductase YuxK